MINLPSTPSQGARQASRELLSHIIHQRVDEIFQLAQREFERAGYGGGRLPAGVVLTGGTAHLPGMVELAREAFAVPVRAGTPEQGISGLVDSVQAPRYAVPVGLVLYAARRLAQGGGGVPSGSLARSAGVERWFGPLKRWWQDFFRSVTRGSHDLRARRVGIAERPDESRRGGRRRPERPEPHCGRGYPVRPGHLRGY